MESGTETDCPYRWNAQAAEEMGLKQDGCTVWDWRYDLKGGQLLHPNDKK